VLNTSNQYRITNKLPAGKYKTEVVKDSWFSSYTVTQPSEVYIKKDARESCNITISGNGTAANNVVTEKNDPGKVEQGKTDQGKTNQEGKTSTDSTNNSGEKNQPEDIYLFYPNEQGNEVQNNEENTAENNTENKDKTGETAADPLNKDTAKTNKEQQPKNENKSAEKPVENNKRLSDNFAVRIVKKNFLTIMMLIGVCIMTIIIKIKSKLEL
jgi:hypothetical protein